MEKLQNQNVFMAKELQAEREGFEAKVQQRHLQELFDIEANKNIDLKDYPHFYRVIFDYMASEYFEDTRDLTSVSTWSELLVFSPVELDKDKLEAFIANKFVVKPTTTIENTPVKNIHAITSKLPQPDRGQSVPDALFHYQWANGAYFVNLVNEQIQVREEVNDTRLARLFPDVRWSDFERSPLSNY